MNAHLQLAQAVPGQSAASLAPRTIKLARPPGSQAITLHLDGAAKLDLSDIADEKLVFVRIGDRLVILFENDSTVAIEPFFDAAGLRPDQDAARRRAGAGHGARLSIRREPQGSARPRPPCECGLTDGDVRPGASQE